MKKVEKNENTVDTNIPPIGHVIIKVERTVVGDQVDTQMTIDTYEISPNDIQEIANSLLSTLKNESVLTPKKNIN